MYPFETVSPHNVRVIFGSGTLQCLSDEVKKLSATHPLLLLTPGSSVRLKDLESFLSRHVLRVSRFEKAVMHTPVTVSEEGAEYAKSMKVDCLVSIGGGSTIGLGSEMTAILGESHGGAKVTVVDSKVRADTVIYDVDLTMTLPTGLSAVSGVNAIAHAVEALYARTRNPIVDMMAKEGIRNLAGALPELMDTPLAAKDARSNALYGAWLCSICAGSVDMALHHKLCHTLGGSFQLSHAETHTIVLPHALAYNAPNIPEQMAVLAEVLPDSEGDAIRGLNMLLAKLKVKRGLKELGMKEEDIATAAELASHATYPNPRELEGRSLQEVIRRCWAGEQARQDL